MTAREAGIVAAAVGVVVALGLVWAWWEARWFAIRRVEVPVLPAGSEPIRLLHVSDAHLVPRQRRKARWLRSLVSVAPDVVVNTGDNIASGDAVPALADALGPLLRLPGAFVLGSNDYLAPRRQNPFTYFRGPTADGGRRATLPTDALVSSLTREGWVNLSNARAETVVRGTTLTFVGLDDPHLQRDEPGNRATGEAEGVVVGVVHAPYARALETLSREGASLLLAGHTHGGQVRIPGIGALVTNCDLDRRRARGLSRWPGSRPGVGGGNAPRWLHVSAGCGTSPYLALRFACRPEATILVLTERDREE